MQIARVKAVGPVRALLACILGAALGGLCAGLAPGFAEGGRDGVASTEAAKAVAQGVSFLQKDTAQWKAEKKCANCHHGTMTVWALNEAKRQGYAVDAAFLSETAQWTKERLAGIEKPRDPRPGWSMISTLALYLSVMAHNQPELDTISRNELRQIADHAARHLEEDGSVLTPATMTPPRPQNGPPPVFESREVLTLLAVLAMQPEEPGDPKEGSPVRAGRQKAETWLAGITPGDDTQAAVLRLLVAVQEKKPRKAIRSSIAGILGRQNPDGGWGQLRELPSDAYATGQALYVLSLAGVDRRRPEIGRAVGFLVRSQRPDGSWPMTSRAHPGATPFKNPAPITHFGSCWGVLGLARSVPAHPNRD